MAGPFVETIVTVAADLANGGEVDTIVTVAAIKTTVSEVDTVITVAAAQTNGGEIGTVLLITAALPLFAPKNGVLLSIVAYRADPNLDNTAALSGYQLDTPGADMIYEDIIFPECIAYGSTHAAKYKTTKLEVPSGYETRQQRQAYPKHMYNVVLQNIPAIELAEFARLYHVVSGDFIGFLFLDPLDHTSNDDPSGWISGTIIDSADQFVATALGTQTDYALYKYYTLGGRQKKRRILYPTSGTLVIEVDGFIVTNFVYNYATRLIQFAAAVGTLNFSANWTVATGILTGADFSGLNLNDLIYLDGLAETASNAPQGGSPHRVLAADGSSVTLEKYDQTAFTGIDEVAVTVTTVQALPPTGAIITSGYYFHVPVRIDDGEAVDIEPTGGLRETMFANMNSVVLREVLE